MPILESARPFHTETGSVGVLFCHGFTGSPSSLRPWADAVAAAGYRVSLPRLPGHGTRWQELTVTRWQDWYACVDREYRALADACETVFVAGLSMGGALTLRLAQHHPEIAGIVLVNPALGAVDKRSLLAPVLQHVITSVPSIGNDIALPGQDEGAYAVTPVAGVAQAQKLFADVKSLLDLVTCPVLIYRSAQDHVVPASSTETILRQVSSRDVREVVLERSYHVATLDHDADTIVRGSLEFFGRLS